MGHCDSSSSWLPVGVMRSEYVCLRNLRRSSVSIDADA
uniref:Uncharacterized protein n=1 Tax=Siphoviridae sp. ct3lF2 TaxID=2825324 RepID=A0A8S5PQC0_9CAUD|nr:MAG TPA: hypothetical protein [Siphoviridae sp. ct3lF2]